MRATEQEGGDGDDDDEDGGGEEEEDEDFDGEVGAFMEAELLEKIATKLTLLTDIAVQRNAMEEVDENLQQ